MRTSAESDAPPVEVGPIHNGQVRFTDVMSTKFSELTNTCMWPYEIVECRCEVDN
jgi:hypothetical protein